MAYSIVYGRNGGRCHIVGDNDAECAAYACILYNIKTVGWRDTEDMCIALMLEHKRSQHGLHDKEPK